MTVVKYDHFLLITLDWNYLKKPKQTFRSTSGDQTQQTTKEYMEGV